jgi:hypothetical protein
VQATGGGAYGGAEVNPFSAAPAGGGGGGPFGIAPPPPPPPIGGAYDNGAAPVSTFGAYDTGAYGRGLHSSTFQLNLSRVCQTSQCPPV